jgi:ribosome maturation factor RimP
MEGVGGLRTINHYKQDLTYIGLIVNQRILHQASLRPISTYLPHQYLAGVASRVRTRRPQDFVKTENVPPVTDVKALEALIAPIVVALGYELVRVRLSGGQDLVLQVMAERPSDGGLDIDECMTISRALSEMLDEKDPIENEYRLEVSSPGIDRPLTRLKDFTRWKNFVARITLATPVDDRKRVQGRIRGLEDDVIILRDEHAVDMRIPFAAIDHAKLVITDDLLLATKPQKMDIGADRMVRPAEPDLMS